MRREAAKARVDMADYYSTIGTATADTLRASITAGGGCSVCTAAEPCLFDVVADPSETKDLAKANPEIVAKMQAKLRNFTAYIGYKMSAAQYAPYECPSDIRPVDDALFAPVFCAVWHATSAAVASSQHPLVQPNSLSAIAFSFSFAKVDLRADERREPRPPFSLPQTPFPSHDPPWPSFAPHLPLPMIFPCPWRRAGRGGATLAARAAGANERGGRGADATKQQWTGTFGVALTAAIFASVWQPQTAANRLEQPQTALNSRKPP
jgi:hypothetical protein